MYKSNSGRPKAGKRDSLPSGLHRELLLYVEDDDDNWEVAQLRLEKTYDLLRATTDEQACALIRQHRGAIDVILMDIALRGSQLNGVELTELLRGNKLSSQKEVPEFALDLPVISRPVVYVTAHGAGYTNAQLMLSGADKVIPKPVNFTQLQTALFELSMERTQG